jgi:hypothetical protein
MYVGIQALQDTIPEESTTRMLVSASAEKHNVRQNENFVNTVVLNIPEFNCLDDTVMLNQKIKAQSCWHELGDGCERRNQ